MFDYDDSINLAFDAKIAGKSLVAAKHELLTKTGDFLFLAHSDRELALRMQMVEEDIEKVAYRKLSSISDSKAKLVRAVFDEWELRHASCDMCKVAEYSYDLPNYFKEPEDPNLSCTGCSVRGAPNLTSECEECGGTGSGRVQKMLNGIGKVPGADMMKKQILDNHAESLARGMKNQIALQKEMQFKLKTRGTPLQGMEALGSKGDQKNCAECGKPATKKDVHGYLELCDNCAK